MRNTKTRFGFYDMMSNDLVPAYFFFTPVLAIAHYSYCIQGGIYAGWLNYTFFIPYKDESGKQYMFNLLPAVGYRAYAGRKILSFSWLFWCFDFLTIGD